MTDTFFDTHAAVEKIREGEKSGRLAESVTEVVRDGINAGGNATKADIAELKRGLAELKENLLIMRSELKWIKIIGGAVLVMLVLPWLAEFLRSFMAGV